MPVIVDEATHGWLVENPGAEVTVDVEALELVLPDDRRIPFPLDAFSRYCLLNGIDQLGYLLRQTDAIAEFETGRPWSP